MVRSVRPKWAARIPARRSRSSGPRPSSSWPQPQYLRRRVTESPVKTMPGTESTLAVRLGPLAEREFRLLFAGRVVSLAGSAIAPIPLPFSLLDLTGSASDLGIVLAAGWMPQIVFILVGGVWADRLPRH